MGHRWSGASIRVDADGASGAGEHGVLRMNRERHADKEDRAMKNGSSQSTTAPPAVIVCHGNAEIIDQYVDMVAAYHRLGCSVSLPEYRGYGRADGSRRVQQKGVRPCRGSG